MDYKQKYEEALENIKKIKETNKDNKELVDFIEFKYPGLKESEDEKLRKRIIKYLEQSQFGEEHYQIDDDIVRGYIAWLEKQVEQKLTCQLDNSVSNVTFPFKAKVKSNGKIVTIHAGQLSTNTKKWIRYQSDVEDGYMVYRPEDLELVCNTEQKPADKVESKFKVGDKIKFAKEPKYPATEIIAIKNDAYYFDELVHLPFSHQDEWELVEQGEQKPIAYFYCKYGGVMPLCSDCKRNHLNSKYKTEEIETWMIPALRCTKQCFSYIQQKPAEWSEEDEKMLNSIIDVLEVTPSARFVPIKREIMIPWLKSLKERMKRE